MRSPEPVSKLQHTKVSLKPRTATLKLALKFFFSPTSAPLPGWHSSWLGVKAKLAASLLGGKRRVKSMSSVLAFGDAAWVLNFCLTWFGLLIWVPAFLGWLGSTENKRELSGLLAAPENLQYHRQTSVGARNYSCPLNNLCLSSASPLICGFFQQTHTVLWLVEFMATELHIQRADYRAWASTNVGILGRSWNQSSVDTKKWQMAVQASEKETGKPLQLWNYMYKPRKDTFP